MHGDGIGADDGRARGDELVDEHERGRLADVVGARLERQAPDGDALALEVALEVREDLLAELLLLALVDGDDGVEDLELVADLAPRADGGAQILGEAAAAEARPREQELRADARVGAHALAHLLDVGAEQLAQVRRGRS